MRKYDRESRANKRLSMDYEQVVWRMSQSADLTGSIESLTARQLSHSPTRGEPLSHTSPSPARRAHSNTPGGDSANGSASVTRRQRRISGGDEDFDRKLRCRSATFSLDKSKALQVKGEGDVGINGTGSGGGSPRKQPVSARSGDHADMIVAAVTTEHDESFSSDHESGDTWDLQSSMESSVILETAQGLSYNINVMDSLNGLAQPDTDTAAHLDDVFVEGATTLQSDKNCVPADVNVEGGNVSGRTDVTVVVVSPASEWKQRAKRSSVVKVNRSELKRFSTVVLKFASVYERKLMLKWFSTGKMKFTVLSVCSNSLKRILILMDTS